MIKERYEQADEILSSYAEKNGQLIGVSRDPNSKEYNGLSLRLERGSDIEKTLETLGFKVIYPAPLEEQIVDKMNEKDKRTYDVCMGDALVIDGDEKSLSLDFEELIGSCYFDAMPDINGYDAKSNSITRYARYGYSPETIANYKKLLDDLGFQTEMNENGSVTVSSDIPYPAVKKSKFEQIYDKAKGKIQGAFAKLKSLVNPKDQVKDNDINERE